MALRTENVQQIQHEQFTCFASDYRTFTVYSFKNRDCRMSLNKPSHLFLKYSK